MVSNPEFLKEGAAIGDFMKPDRIVVGTDNPRTAELLKALYDPFTRNRERMIVMDVRSSELTKYAANAMLATKISFMNELANLAERMGADIEKVRLGIGSDPRIGYHFIYPGCGYGGSCFPKDVQALARSAARPCVRRRAARTPSRRSTTGRSACCSRRSSATSAASSAGKTIALWGLAFKPNTDDMREAPSRTLMEALWAAGAKVRAYDPVAMRGGAAHLRRARRPRAVSSSADEALRGRGRAGDRHRVAGVPQPRLRRDQGRALRPGDLRRTQPLRPGVREALRPQVLRNRPGRQRYVDSGHSFRRLGHPALAAVARAVSEAAAAAGRQGHDAAGDARAARRACPMSARRSWCATRVIASWSPSSCASAASQPQAILLEPVGRNTAPAVAIAAMAAVADSPPGKAHSDPVLLVLPADHVIRDVRAFQAAVAIGRKAAAAGQARHLRRRADQARNRLRLHPRAARRGGPCIRIAQFVEKPDLRDRAGATSNPSEYFWNSGMFMFRASAVLDELRALAPEIYEACAQAFTAAKRDLDFTRLPAKEFGACPSDSFDYAVMEKTQHGVVVPLDAGWSDVGSWSALHEAIAGDERRQCAHRRCADGRHARLLSAVDQPPGRGGRARRITSSSKRRMRCWSRRRTACRT